MRRCEEPESPLPALISVNAFCFNRVEAETISSRPWEDIMSVQPVRARPSPRPPETPRGLALLRDPLLNKGTAFTEAERDALGLRGFLPAHVLSMQDQVERVLVNLRRLPNG